MIKFFLLLTTTLLFAACKEEAKEQPKEQAQSVSSEVIEAVIDSAKQDTIAASDKICFVVNDDVKLPYKGKIDFRNAKYTISDCDPRKVEKIDCELSYEGLRYISLLKKGDVSLVLYPVDCGDFPYHYFLLTIKNNKVVSDLYVEGERYEEIDNKELTSFEIDTSYNIIVTTKWQKEDIWTSSGTNIYEVLENGKIIEKDNSSKEDFSGRVKGFYAWYADVDTTEFSSTDTLIGLFCENGTCHLKREKIAFSPEWGWCGMDEDTTFRLKSEAKYLFLNFKDYNKKKFQAVPLTKCEVHSKDTTNRCMYEEWIDMNPGEKFAFDFGGKQYELQAFGEKGDFDKCHCDTENYSIVLSIKASHKNDKKQTIVSMPTLLNSRLELLFIGDLDGDGKPDFILNAESDYMAVVTRLFLSSTAKEYKLLRLEGLTGYVADC